MARKKGIKIPGVSFSAKRALGVTSAKRKISRATGIPMSKAARQRKAGQLMGCGIYVFGPLAAVVLAVALLLVWVV